MSAWPPFFPVFLHFKLSSPFLHFYRLEVVKQLSAFFPLLPSLVVDMIQITEAENWPGHGVTQVKHFSISHSSITSVHLPIPFFPGVYLPVLCWMLRKLGCFCPPQSCCWVDGPATALTCIRAETKQAAFSVPSQKHTSAFGQSFLLRILFWTCNLQLLFTSLPFPFLHDHLYTLEAQASRESSFLWEVSFINAKSSWLLSSFPDIEWRARDLISLYKFCSYFLRKCICSLNKDMTDGISLDQNWFVSVKNILDTPMISGQDSSSVEQHKVSKTGVCCTVSVILEMLWSSETSCTNINAALF